MRSLRRMAAYLRRAATSISPHTAWMTTAESTVRGSDDNAGATSASTSSTSVAAAIPVICERLPVRYAAAVFDSEPPTPSPPENPAPMLAAPVASSSWSASTR